MTLLTRPRTSPPEAQVLIKEARTLRRRRWTIGVVAGLVAVAAATSLVLASSGGSTPAPRRSASVTSPPPRATTAAIGHLLAASSLGPQTSVVAGSMLSASAGFALAAGPRSTSGFVVATVDAGRTWVVRGIAPFSLRDVAGTPPVLRFVSPLVGYADSDAGVYVTRDGGRSWSALAAPRAEFGGGPYPLPEPTITLAGGAVDLLGQRCGPLRCQLLVAQFGLGAVRPERRLVAPGGTLWYGTPSFLTSPAPGLLALAEGSWWHHAAALYLSRDAGTTWSRATSPCRGRTQSSSIVAVRSGSWLTTCFVGEGMTQGLSEMWQSADQGSTWTEVAAGDEGGEVHGHGNLPDAAASLSSSNNRSLVWGLLGWAPGGVMLSTDDGASWTVLHQNTGESWESIAPAGPDGAVVFTPGASLWTTDGRHFVARRLPRS